MIYYDSDGAYIFRASKRTKDGTVIYAKDYGLRGFKIYIKKFSSNGKA